MPDLEIVIRTKAELAGAKAALESLEEQIGAAKALGKSTNELEAQRAKAASLVSGAEGSFGGLGALTKVAAGLASVSTAFATAKKAIAEYAEAESQVAALDAALAQNGLLTDSYRERLQALAGELQKTTAIADEQWLGVLTRLTQFGADETNIDQYAEGVKNLAGIMGGDVQSAANAMSRAMQGNFELFSRYGIRVDEAATQTERMDKLMAQLAQRGGGQLEARASSLVGQWSKLKNGTNDLLESLGGLVARSGVLQGVLGMLSTAATYWANALGGVIPKLQGMQNATRSAAAAAAEAAAAQKRQADAVKLVEDRAKDATSALARMDQQLQQQKDLADELADAQRDYELAIVDANEEKGAISKSDAEVKRAQIRKQFAEEAFVREQELRAQQAANAEARVAEIKREVDELQKLVALEEKRVAMAQDAEALEAERNRVKANVQEMQARLNAIDEELAIPSTNQAASHYGNRQNLETERANVAYSIETGLKRLRQLSQSRDATRSSAPDDLGSMRSEEARLSTTKTLLKGAQERSKEVPRLTFEADMLRRGITGAQDVFQVRRSADDVRSRTAISQAETQEAKDQLQRLKGGVGAVAAGAAEMAKAMHNGAAVINREVQIVNQTRIFRTWIANQRTP